jgi:hypothetical protein
MGVFGSSKHLSTVNFDDEWHYIVFGDHPHISAPLPLSAFEPFTGTLPETSAGGRQEIVRFKLAVAADGSVTCVAELVKGYYDPNPANLEFAFPDDGWARRRFKEVWRCCGSTNCHIPPPQPIGMATQVFGHVMANRLDGTGDHELGPTPRTRAEMGGNSCWGALHDPATDRMIVPVERGGLIFFVMNGSDGADLTPRNSLGVPFIRKVNGADLDLHVAGMAMDPRPGKRDWYCYDHTTTGLWTGKLDAILTAPAPRLICMLPDAKQAAEGQAKIAWDDDHDGVLIAAKRMHFYEPDPNLLSSQDRPDGWASVTAPNAWVLPSTIFRDPLTKSFISLGGIDWSTNGYSHPYFWQLHIA